MKLITPKTQMDAAVSDADLKTLKLSTPLITREALDRYIQFQRAYVEHLERTPDKQASTLARAHEEAAAKSGAHIDEIGRVGAICTDYAGRRTVEQTLENKREKTQQSLDRARASGAPASERDLEVQQKIAEQFASGSAWDHLTRRYGLELVEVLKSREGELLELHKRQTAAHL